MKFSTQIYGYFVSWMAAWNSGCRSARFLSRHAEIWNSAQYMLKFRTNPFHSVWPSLLFQFPVTGLVCWWMDMQELCDPYISVHQDISPGILLEILGRSPIWTVRHSTVLWFFTKAEPDADELVCSNVDQPTNFEAYVCRQACVCCSDVSNDALPWSKLYDPEPYVSTGKHVTHSILFLLW